MAMEHSTPKPRVSLHDIARRVHVSQPTVSRALKDDPRISVATRQKVHRAAREMGYQPDPMLTALAHYRRGKTMTPVSSSLAWINLWRGPKLLRSFREFELYWQGAAAEAERCGYRLEEFVYDELEPHGRLEKILLTRNVRGILIPPTQRGRQPEWHDFPWDEFCVVRFGHSVHVPRAHLVSSDQLTDGLIAYENIRQKGYQRIGLVTTARVQTRFTAGYLFRQLNMDPHLRVPPLILPQTVDEQNDRELAGWLKQYKPDAILTDVAPLRAMLGQAGYRVPRDIGLAVLSVLDGNADAGINQNSAVIGEAAVQMLISLIHHNERGIPKVCRELLVEGEWVDGRTLPPRKTQR